MAVNPVWIFVWHNDSLVIREGAGHRRQDSLMPCNCQVVLTIKYLLKKRFNQP